MADDDSNYPCLVDLYEGDSCELVTLLETSLEDLKSEPDKWKNIIYSHIERTLRSPRSLKIENFGEGLEWINSKLLALDDELLNKVLVFDFFTYCCINCEHALPFVQNVEQEFKENHELAVIGVHSPKFPNEKALDNVKNAVLRNKIEHPVINDSENYLWNKLGIYCWPTVLITSPAHHVLFYLVGEVQIEKLLYLCHQTLNYFTTNYTLLNTSPLPLKLTEESIKSSSLLYPSGISTHGTSVIVSDTGHNRLLLLSSGGKVQDVIGCGSPGFKDGSFIDCSFNRPQGTTWWKANFIFVADTGNNCIRMVDLKGKKVCTVFNGNDKFLKSEETSVLNFASPWDVCIGPKLDSNMEELNVLYIAVAGSHQIWAMHLDDILISSEEYSSLECVPFAGNGTEECRNNTYKMKAGFAQPSGVAYSELCPGMLFIADSESSTIRSISLINGSVKTVVGGGLDPKNLFQYGDKDGSGLDVKLQHPLGICVMEESKIFIADTYNHKIKLINDKKRECHTFAGKGFLADNSVPNCEFDEPSAICYSSQEKCLFVADTNNHTIKIIVPESKTIKTMPIIFPDASCVDSPCNKHISYKDDSNYRKIKLSFGGTIMCSFKLIEPGISLTEGAPQLWNISVKGGCNWSVASMSNSLFDSHQQPSLILKCTDDDTNAHNLEITISVNLTVCDAAYKICMPKKIILKLDVEVSKDGSDVYDGIFVFN
ncbi:NHL repeat-containing protein 2 [Caerostris extrusa]|uniref:NHL repeat-containing protein 2 n=1 Tax=Caerostris extrusa TaxID=172846 RepID=A0AAV4VJF8_CAEEX|nr:NHL repeat-containing protein 2 [Caerostris extrusa]